MPAPYRIINGSVFKVETSPDEFVKELIVKILNHSDGETICKILKEKLPHLENLIIEKEND